MRPGVSNCIVQAAVLHGNTPGLGGSGGPKIICRHFHSVTAGAAAGRARL